MSEVCRAPGGDLLLGPQYHLSQECVSVSDRHTALCSTPLHPPVNGMGSTGLGSLSLSLSPSLPPSLSLGDQRESEREGARGKEGETEREREREWACVMFFYVVFTCVCASAFLIICDVCLLIYFDIQMIKQNQRYFFCSCCNCNFFV